MGVHMAKRKRRSFTNEFKHEAVSLVLKDGRTVNDVADQLGIYWSTLSGWVKQAEVDQGRGAPGALRSDEREELQRLRKKVKELETEKAILKKAAAFFAKENN